MTTMFYFRNLCFLEDYNNQIPINGVLLTYKIIPYNYYNMKLESLNLIYDNFYGWNR